MLKPADSSDGGSPDHNAGANGATPPASARMTEGSMNGSGTPMPSMERPGDLAPPADVDDTANRPA